MNKKRTVLLGILIIIVIFTVIMEIRISKSKKESAVYAEAIVRRNLQESISATGKFESRRTINISVANTSATEMKVKKVKVSVGDLVKKMIL